MDSPKARGFVTTLVSGLASGLLQLFLTNVGVSVNVAYIIYSVIGNILAYSLDIIFAKKSFVISNALTGQKPFVGPLKYTDYNTRLWWLLGSFASTYFFRFIVSVIIDTIIALILLEYLIQLLDKHNIHFWMRDFIVSMAVPVFTFTLYLNVLRFDWVYKDERSPTLDIIVFMWTTLILILFTMRRQQQNPDLNNSNKERKMPEE